MNISMPFIRITVTDLKDLLNRSCKKRGSASINSKKEVHHSFNEWRTSYNLVSSLLAIFLKKWEAGQSMICLNRYKLVAVID